MESLLLKKEPVSIKIRFQKVLLTCQNGPRGPFPIGCAWTMPSNTPLTKTPSPEVENETWYHEVGSHLSKTSKGSSSMK